MRRRSWSPAPRCQMQSPHTRSACPDCSQKTLLLDLPFPIAELWMWKHTACADPRGRAQADAQHTEHLCFVPVSVTHLLLSGGHTHTHTQMSTVRSSSHPGLPLHCFSAQNRLKNLCWEWGGGKTRGEKITSYLPRFLVRGSWTI